MARRTWPCHLPDRLNIEVIPGGLPSVGRNAGARTRYTPYVLFIDADMELKDPTLLRRAMELVERRKLHCVTTNIWCSQGTCATRSFTSSTTWRSTDRSGDAIQHGNVHAVR